MTKKRRCPNPEFQKCMIFIIIFKYPNKNVNIFLSNLTKIYLVKIDKTSRTPSIILKFSEWTLNLFHNFSGRIENKWISSRAKFYGGGKKTLCPTKILSTLFVYLICQRDFYWKFDWMNQITKFCISFCRNFQALSRKCQFSFS